LPHCEDQVERVCVPVHLVRLDLGWVRDVGVIEQILNTNTKLRVSLVAMGLKPKRIDDTGMPRQVDEMQKT